MNASKIRSSGSLRCLLCIKQTSRCLVEADGRIWCGGGHGRVPGFEVLEERDGLTVYIAVPPSPFPVPTPAPLGALPENVDFLGTHFEGAQAAYYRAAQRACEAERRAVLYRAAGTPAEAERAGLDHLEALGDAHAARDRAALAHIFAARAARELYPASAPLAAELHELHAELAEVAEAVARLERGRAARGAA